MFSFSRASSVYVFVFRTHLTPWLGVRWTPGWPGVALKVITHQLYRYPHHRGRIRDNHYASAA